MEWLTKMNDALDYIEDHIAEKVEPAEAARRACSSLSRFQRMFAFVTDTTVAEYIRCRRMALAARDLLDSDVKVIDLAAKYGYESPEAFTRAFQAFHGLTPTAVRKLRTYTDYPRLTFRATISGRSLDLAGKPLVRIEEHGRERVVSFAVNCRGPEEAAWNLLRKWAGDSLSDFPARRCIGCAPRGHHPDGEAHRPDEGPGHHEYVAEMFLLADEGRGDTFLGAPVRDAPTGLYLIGDVVFNEVRDDGTIDIGASMQNSYSVMAECLRDMGGYEFELADRPYYEEHIFSREWFDHGGEPAGFRLWLPIRKAGSN